MTFIESPECKVLWKDGYEDRKRYKENRRENK
jgi:hypothetical protein